MPNSSDFGRARDSSQEGQRIAAKVVVREASIEDRQEIWEWWNDPVTRRMMKQNDYVPWEAHCDWFTRVLIDRNVILCIAEDRSNKIGIVRFDWQSATVYEISINLNPQFRGFGYAPILLTESIEYLKMVRHVTLVFAMLKKINVPSERTFARAGFTYVDPPKTFYPGMEVFEPESEYYCEKAL